MKPHICHVFPAFATGGPEVRTAIVINATADRFRHTVLSITGDRSGESRITANGDTHVDCVPSPGRWTGYPAVLTRTLRALKPNLLVSYGWGGIDAILAGRACGVRRIIHGEDGFLPDEAHRQRVHRLVARQLILRAASCVVVPSRTLVGIAHRLWHLPARRVHHVPNGVDTSHFSPGSSGERAAARRRFGFRTGDVVVGTVGHLRPEKNHARLIHALAQQDRALPIRLLVIGEGNLRGDLERLARDRGVLDRVVLPGASRDPAEAYRAMDLFALSSDTEQMPIVALEAMASGLAVVSTAVGDVREMVSAENRQYVTPLGDEARFNEALAAIVDDPQRREMLGQANRSRCLAMYGVGEMVRRYEALYSDVLESP